ncbi:nephrin-like [Gigantopelta aegis]|uniref:nephrin-like n=1 Tax=Gigantopelta aegis TaxID=1735272 RepID=UPI001B88A29B|nr:nephrin-like [Gigantopelta aegis]
MAVLMHILVYISAVNHVLGASLSVSGSSRYAELNRPFTLTCTVSQAANLIDKVLFITRASTDAFASLRQNMASCSVFNVARPGYTVSCGSGTDSSSSSTKTYSLTINRAAEHDAKDWWCDLSTAKTRSNTFSLQFSRGPDSVTLSPPPPGSVAEGDSLTVTCAASCNPPCSYSWTLGNQRISATSQLTLTNINRSQTGNVYMCTATNSLIPKSKTKQFTLTVYYGPDSVQLNTTSPLTVKEGDDVAVPCGATNCSPSCSFMWKFKSQIKSSSDVLSLNNIQRSSAGSPRLDHRVSFQKEFATAVGGDVTLKISVIANPTPTFTWYNLTDGNKNRLGSRSPATTGVSAVGKLTLTNVQHGDIGTYQVVVSNGAKDTDLVKNVTLDVSGSPNIPSALSVWSSDPHSVSVAWLEGFNGGSEQTFLVQYRVDTISRWTNVTEVILEKGVNTIQKAVISNLQPKTRYLVRVLAYNIYGYKGFTKEQETLTLPPGESFLPTSSNKLTGEGIALGIVIGIATAVWIETFFVILWRRGFVCASSKSDGKQSEGNVHQHGQLDDTRRGNRTELDNSGDQANTYEGLGIREDTPYAKMELYENLKT